MGCASIGRASLLAALLCGAASATAAAPLPPLDATSSLLVVAPHPDDETLCCAGLMQRVARAGGRVSVVWITSGDGSWLDLLVIEKSLLHRAQRSRDLGERRMREARAATSLLGVPPQGQLFLGYPDRGLAQLLAAYRTLPYTSAYNGAAAVPYPDALYPAHPYSGTSLERDLASVMERVHPTLILAPTPLDSHPDHRATGEATVEVAARLHLLSALRYWIVHGGEGWPSPRELMLGVPLTPAPRMRGVAQTPFALTAAEEDRKQRALEAYATQMRLLAPFLLSFVRTDELFATLPAP